MEFVLIPAGEFMMGSTEGKRNETPVHKVRISRPFYLGKHEVTQAQWEVVMGDNPSFFMGVPDRSVEMVSWREVQTFIRKLNAGEGVSLYRLPTEAEWEYAARAGTTTAYSFGEDANRLSEYAWYKSSKSGLGAHLVGQKKPNPWGLYDMHGNVSEWVQDWYQDYPSEPVTDPTGPTKGAIRVFRGGSWLNDASYCRSAHRDHVAPDFSDRNLGFRVVLLP